MTLLDRLQALAEQATSGEWFTPYERGAVFEALPLLIQACRALAVVHEHQCGCDNPGGAGCVAAPLYAFAALAPLTGSGDSE